ncbi:hypothetical protein L1987_64460 [Smallanthus sonchifolius]|uniref:Uncharacterized protein n=1 Tax=Smallanthus sonchifolius TaxID=185202 RepID=A0ACB9CG53_9ASTR|nr:hypothetical protein L1987_64460 [Smallanthus sonchifolius]
MGVSNIPKPISALNDDEKKLYDREKKALAALSMCLTLDIYHTFKKFKTSRVLWEGLAKRCEGSTDIKKSRKELLKKQFSVFKHFDGESVDELMSRYYHLLSEMINNDITYKNKKILEKFLDALPAHFEMYTIVIKEQSRFDDLSTLASKSGGVALFLGESFDVPKDSSCQENTCFVASKSGCSTHSKNEGHSCSTKVSPSAANDMMAMIASFLTSYENFIREMNIQWNMTLWLRQGKDHLKRTGKKFIGASRKTKMGMDKSKGIHLEDIVAHVSQTFLAEVHHEDGIESGSSDSDSIDFLKVTEKIAEMLAEGNAFMADSKQVKQVNSCLKCIDFEFKITRLCDDNTNFICDMKAMYTSNQTLKDNETVLKAKIESLKDDIKVLQTKVNEQAFHLDVSYSEYEKKMNELAVLQTDVKKLLRKLECYKNSSFLLEYYNVKASGEKVIGGVGSCPSFDDTDIGRGVGYYPPFNANYTPCLIEEVLVEDLEPKTVLNINHVTSNDMVYDDSTDDDVFDSEKVEGIVKDCKYVEPVVIKTVTRDMCILTEPDDVQKENYVRVYKEKHACFYCGAVGHILNDCPNKNLGKRLENPKLARPLVNPPAKSVSKIVDSGVKKPSVQTASDKVKIVKTIESIGETTQPKEKLSRPQRRRKNKRLRKLLEQPVVNDKVEVSRETDKVPVSSKWKPKSTVSGKQSPKIQEKFDCVLKKIVYFDEPGQPKTTMAWVSITKKSFLFVCRELQGGLLATIGKKGGNISGQGTVSNGRLSFEKVNYVEQLEHNLLSVSQVCDKDFSFHFNKSECLVLKTGFVIHEDWMLMRAPRKNDTYMLDMSTATATSSVPSCLLSNASEFDSTLWHRKMAHINFRKMNYFVKNGLISGVQVMRFHVNEDCIPYKKGKQHRKSHPSKLTNSIVTPLELLHMDLFGPISVKSEGGKSNFLVVTDDYSWFSWVKFLASKDETSEILKFLIKGIHHEFSAPYVPQQNGVAERKNRTLIEMARIVLSDSKLPVTFWAEAVNTACHVLNRVLTVKKHNKTCYELLNNRKPYLAYLLPFGNPCTLLKTRDVPTKFSSKAIEGIFLGYVANSHNKRVFNKESRQIEEWFHIDCDNRSVPQDAKGPSWAFDYGALFRSFNVTPAISPVEAEILYQSYCNDDLTVDPRSVIPIVDTPSVDPNVASTSGRTQHDDTDDDEVVFQESSNDIVNIVDDSSASVSIEGELPSNLDAVIQALDIPQSRVHKNHPTDNIIGDLNAGVQMRHRTLARNSCLYINIVDTGILETCLHACFISQTEPKNVVEALDDDCWIEAIQEELAQFDKLHVWDLVDLPNGSRSIGIKWVFKCKRDDRGVVVRNKARLVVQGFNQQEGIDYTEVYAPVARIEVIRLFLVYASFKGFKVFQLDVKSDFLYGKVKEEVNVKQPPGFEDPKFPEKVFKLDKALYGLHQARRAWYETLSVHLLENGFERGQIDSTLFNRKAVGDLLLVQIYVDDIFFGSTNVDMCKDFERVMKLKFEMSSKGELSFFLGLQVDQKEDGFYIHQTKYVADILKKFDMENALAFNTPILVNHKLDSDLKGKEVDCRLYRGIIGSLMYLAASRPDIMFAILKG